MNNTSSTSDSSQTASSGPSPSTSSEKWVQASLLRELVQQEYINREELVVEEAQVSQALHGREGADLESTRIAQADALADCGAGGFGCMSLCLYKRACVCIHNPYSSM
jgi:hypothetical protein